MSTPLNLAEQLLLLALDEKGADRANWGTGVETGLAGALLLELAAAGCLAEEGGRLVPAGCDPPDDPLLRDALDVVRDSDRPRRAASWIRRLPRALRPLRLRAAERLVARGVLAEERRRALGLRRTRLPEVDPGPEAALRERLREVLTGAAEPAPREAMLIALMEPYELVGRVVERGERRDAKRRAKEMRRRIGVAGAVGDAVRSAQASAVAAVVAASSAAAISGGGGGGGGGGG